MIGRLISGRYRIEAVVGTGGMAVVYRALDLQENRTVAIKVLRPEYESDMEFVRRFGREAEAAANKLIASSLTDSLIRYTQANRWNGSLPQIVGNSTALPVLDLTGADAN